MTFQQILDEILLVAEMLLPIAGQPGAAAIIAVVQPRLDALIVKLSDDLAANASAMGMTLEQIAAFQARIDAIKTDPAWEVAP